MGDEEIEDEENLKTHGKKTKTCRWLTYLKNILDQSVH
jgi:hypothetical protein